MAKEKCNRNTIVPKQGLPLEFEAYYEEATCPNLMDDVCCKEDNITPAFGEWPHTCLMFKKGTEKQIGGASMLTPESVITAAHKIE